MTDRVARAWYLVSRGPVPHDPAAAVVGGVARLWRRRLLGFFPGHGEGFFIAYT